MDSLATQTFDVFMWIVRATVHASVLVCLILLIRVLADRTLAPRWQFCLWLPLLVRLVMPWGPASSLSVLNWVPSIQDPRQIDGVGEDVEAEAGLASFVGSSANGDATTEDRAGDATKASADGFGGAWSWIRALSTIWLVGVAVAAVYAASVNFRFWNRIRRDRPVTNQSILDLLEACKSSMGVYTCLPVVRTSHVQSPSLFGFIRPRLLFPDGMVETLGPPELRHVFLHELAHLKRHDVALSWLMALLGVLHWFNPLVWFAFHRMRVDRELACDALVLSRTGASEAQSYGHTILGLLQRLSGRQRLPGMAGVVEGKSNLKRRIAMIARFRNEPLRRSIVGVSLLAGLTCVGLTDARSAPEGDAAQAGDTYIVVFGARGSFQPTTAEQLIKAFNEVHPQGVRTHRFRTKADGERLTGYICVDTESGKEAVVAAVNESQKVQIFEVKQASQEDIDRLEAMKQPSVKSGGRGRSESGARKFSPAGITIFPGKGLDNIRLGDNIDGVPGILGEPDEKTELARTVLFKYRTRLGIQFEADKGTRKIGGMLFDKPAFRGRLENGVKLGDSVDKAVEACGGALKTVEATQVETHGVKLGRDRVLYKQMNQSGRGFNAYKFIDEKQGLLIWFGADKKAVQIVIFPPVKDSSAPVEESSPPKADAPAGKTGQ